MPAKYSFNADTSSISYEKILASFRASGASIHMIMLDPKSYFLGAGDVATIKKYLNDLPNVTLIVRTFHNSQGDWQNYPDAIPDSSGKRTKNYETHWTWLRVQLGDLAKRVILDSPFNEPNLDDNPTNAKKFVDYCIYLVRSASNAGMKLAIGAFSVGVPHESLFETEYLPLWKAIAQYQMGISLHLYAAIPFEAGEQVPLNIVLNARLARHFMLDERWGMDYQGWFIGRAYRYIQVFERYGLGIPDLFVTECLVDNVFNTDSSAIKEMWKVKYNSPAYPDPRGVRCWEKYLLEMFKEDGFDFQQSLKFLFRHARKNIFFHPAFKALCIFALNSQWDYPNGTNKEAGSNFAHPALDVFTMKYIPEINAEIYGDTPLMPVPSDSLVPMQIRSTASATNIRANASTTSAKLGVISAEWTDCLVSQNWQETGLLWVKLQLGNLTGYASREWIAIQARPIVIPPPIETEPKYLVELGYMTTEMTEAEIDKFASIYEGIAAAIRTAPRTPL